jgi:hypothetical protein
MAGEDRRISAWRAQAVVRIAELRHEMQLVGRGVNMPTADGGAAQAGPDVRTELCCTFIGERLDAAQSAATRTQWRTRFAVGLTGRDVETVWRNIHAAEAELLRIIPGTDIGAGHVRTSPACRCAAARRTARTRSRAARRRPGYAWRARSGSDAEVPSRPSTRCRMSAHERRRRVGGRRSARRTRQEDRSEWAAPGETFIDRGRHDTMTSVRNPTHRHLRFPRRTLGLTRQTSAMTNRHVARTRRGRGRRPGAPT